ncbi:hypothetical protein RB195_024623 [Necator americanus]|uniref:Uncharacterized protein n=1 Tax=Necator americanus TaxID=51031 RepID=A0ABR1EP16_NECAM
MSLCDAESSKKSSNEGVRFVADHAWAAITIPAIEYRLLYKSEVLSPITVLDRSDYRDDTQPSFSRKQGKSSYGSSMVDDMEDDDLYEFLEDEENEDDEIEGE